jgi:hypothetical protein
VTAPLPGNGKSPHSFGIPLLALIPAGVFAPQFQIIAVWHTGTGIQCPPREVPTSPLPPEMVVELFVALVNEGLVRHLVEEDGVLVEAPFPPLQLVFGAPPADPNAPPEPDTAPQPGQPGLIVPP